MAFKALFGNNSGDFKNAADAFGYFDDTVYGVREGLGNSYTILTYRGRDLIDLRDGFVGTSYFVFAGPGDDRVLGGEVVETVRDQSGNDLYSLAGGNDYVFMGRGNDTIDGGRGTDSIAFGILYDDYGAGTVLQAAVRVDLRLTSAQSLGVFGRDVIRSVENIGAGEGNDTLYGNNARNTITGGAGNDYIRGIGGNDRLYGDNGADTLIGDSGADVLVSVADGARDVIRYLRISDSPYGRSLSLTDTIFNFDQGGGAADDRIDLSRIDARAGTAANDAFVFRGVGGSFTSTRGEVRIVESGGNSVVYVDNDGDRTAEMAFVVYATTGLTAADFIL